MVSCGSNPVAVTRFGRGDSGDAQALAGFGVTAKALGALDRDAGSGGIAGAAESAEGGVCGANAVRAGSAFARAGGCVGTDPSVARGQNAGIRFGAVSIDTTFDRGAVASQAGLTYAAAGIVAAVTGGTDRRSGRIGAANRAFVTVMLPADADLAAYIAGAGLDRAIFDRATRPGAAGDAGVSARIRATAALAGRAAAISVRAWTEIRHRAAKVFAVAVPIAAGVAAAFRVVRVGGCEMRMATLFAAEFTPRGVGEIGADIAAAVRCGAGAGTNGTLAAGLRCAIEAAALGFDQRLEADDVLARLGLQHRRRTFGLGGLMQRDR